MKLYEFEGKKLFAQCGLPVPRGLTISSPDELDRASISFDATAVKAQVLTGKRAAKGGIQLCQGLKETKRAAAGLLGHRLGREKVKQVLVEEHLPIIKEYYLSVAYNTRTRTPAALVSARGGSGLEKRRRKPTEWAIDMTKGFQPWMARTLLVKAGLPRTEILSLTPLLTRLVACFFKFDCRICEINPLTILKDGELLADDAKVVLDDEALVRHPELKMPPRRATGRELNQRELAARQIDQQDHRGVAGSVYYDLDGDIAILASGGGELQASMDVLLALGGKPANFTEYSGNPPAEKVEKLTRIILSKPNLAGCWVVGGTANFTDIYETLRGFMAALVNLRPRPAYPIVIRRWGPRAPEAFAYLKKAARENNLNLHLFGQETPATESAQKLMTLVQQYKAVVKNKKGTSRARL